jgi:hypothetical protein
MSKDDVKLKKAAEDAVVASKNCHDYIDLLAQCPKFVIFTKANRLQIIHEPTKDQIRKRGKARWKIAFVTNNLHEADKGLMEAFGKLP